MARFRKASADEARARRAGQVRKAIGGSEAVIKGFRSPPSWDPAKRSAGFIMSSETVDRYGDIVAQAGLDVTRFADNPVGLLFHNSRSWPCGQWSDITKVLNGRPKRTEGLLTLLPVGADEDVDRAANHVAAGTIRTVSIGFIPDWDQVELILDDEEEYVTGFKFNASELVECSLVPIPANPDALVKDAGGDLQLARDIVEDILDNYARSPEGVLVPRSVYEKQYKVIVERIAQDEIAPAAEAKVEAEGADEAGTEAAAEVEVTEVAKDAADAGQIKAPAELLAQLKVGDVVTLRRGLIAAEPIDGWRSYAKSEKGGVATIARGNTEIEISIDEVPDDFDELVTKHLAGLATNDADVEQIASADETAGIDMKNGLTITLNVDTAEAEAKVSAFGKLVEGVQANLAKLFGTKNAPAAPSADRTEPVVDTTPTPEQIESARAAGRAVLANLQSKGRIAA